jgi:threonine dehydrogenase-like Zn-dependent dehydrogenase
MRGAVLYGPRDVRFEERETPKIMKPTDAIIRISATCVCGSDLWPYRGIQPIAQPTPMGHEYCGIVEEVGSAVTSIKPGQFRTDNRSGTLVSLVDPRYRWPRTVKSNQ